MLLQNEYPDITIFPSSVHPLSRMHRNLQFFFLSGRCPMIQDWLHSWLNFLNQLRNIIKNFLFLLLIYRNRNFLN